LEDDPGRGRSSGRFRAEPDGSSRPAPRGSRPFSHPQRGRDNQPEDDVCQQEKPEDSGLARGRRPPTRTSIDLPGMEGALSSAGRRCLVRPRVLRSNQLNQAPLALADGRRTSFPLTQRCRTRLERAEVRKLRMYARRDALIGLVVNGVPAFHVPGRRRRTGAHLAASPWRYCSIRPASARSSSGQPWSATIARQTRGTSRVVDTVKE
jgi:hypothetical protein